MDIVALRRRARQPTGLLPLSLHDALPILPQCYERALGSRLDLFDIGRAAEGFDQNDLQEPFDLVGERAEAVDQRSEEHTAELQSRPHLVCRLLLETQNRRTFSLPPRVPPD